MKPKGHLITGIIGGFLAGLFIGIDLFLFGVVESDSAVITVLPIVGIAAGVAMAYWAPFRGKARPSASATEPEAPPSPETS